MSFALVESIYLILVRELDGHLSFGDLIAQQDSRLRLIGSEKIRERGAALTSLLQSFETELLTQVGP